MKSLLKVGLAVALIAACLLNTVVSAYFYKRYSYDYDRLRALDSEVQGLRHSVRDRWETRRVRVEIVTAFRPTTTNSPALLSVSLAHTLPGTNGAQRFRILLWKEPGRAVAAWMNEWEPREEIVKFDQFDVSPSEDGQAIEVLAKPKAGETINMKFVVSFLVQRFGERDEPQPPSPADAAAPNR